MKCQRFVEHHDPWTHSMAGRTERCKRNGVTSRFISNGKEVHVCNQHAKEIDYRMGSNFYKTPDNFFDLSDEPARDDGVGRKPDYEVCPADAGLTVTILDPRD